MCIFSFTSAQYLDHLCVVTTAWVFPAIQWHTKAPHRDSFSPASRQLYSTQPDNNSQPGAFMLMLLCPRTSPYPESTQAKAHRSATLISAHKDPAFLILFGHISLISLLWIFLSASLTFEVCTG